MAGDWIAWSKGLSRKPEVIAISKVTGRARREVTCTLMEFWEWADAETVNGFVQDVRVHDLCELIPATDEAFWLAVVQVGWLVQRTDGVELPNFERWMGKSAKRRLANTRRQQRSRVSRSERDKSATRGEESRGKKRKSQGVKPPETPLPGEPGDGDGNTKTDTGLFGDTSPPQPEADKARKSDDPPADSSRGKIRETGTARPRDELFDAVAEVTNSDPKVSGPFIGRICKALRSADPPYTPAEVRRWADEITADFRLDSAPGLEMVMKYIGRVRGDKRKPANGKPAKGRASEFTRHRFREDAGVIAQPASGSMAEGLHG